MRIAVIGDSILWGQGLRHEQKIATQVAHALAGGPHEVFNFAHSGTDVWHDGEDELDILNPIPGRLQALDRVPSRQDRDEEEPSLEPATREHLGEMPSETPFSLRQVDRAAEELAGTPPGLILLDAGINDVNVTNLILPFKSRGALMARTLSASDRIKCLLEHAHDTFPTARIVVTGYYPVVSQHSDISELLQFGVQFLSAVPSSWLRHFNLSAYRLALESAVAFLGPEWAELDRTLAAPHAFGFGLGQLAIFDNLIGLRRRTLRSWATRLVELSRTFAETAHDVLTREVAAFNLRYASGAVRATLAIPEFPAEHAIQTETPWLFGLGDGLAPQDPLADRRRTLCDELHAEPHQRFIWERASVGHPNALGAQAYVRAILAALG